MSLLNLPVPTDIPSLIAAMEVLHSPRGPYVTYCTPTNEVFIIFRPEPEDLTEANFLAPVFSSEKSAVRAFWNEFIKYSASRSGHKLYWRTKPTVAVTYISTTNVATYTIYARLLLSNQKIVSREFENECLGLKVA